MAVLIAGLALGAASGILGGMQKNAEAEHRTQQAVNNWVQGEMQKGINNGKEIFNASYAMQQQTERNAAIQRSSYVFEQDSLDAARRQQTFVHSQLSRTNRQMMGALAGQMVASGTSRGGTANALRMSQSLNFLRQAQQADQNFTQAETNIKRQAQNMMNQQRNDLILPNIQLASQKPIAEASGSMNLIAGGIGGTLSGLSIGLGG